jgi:hypothetical protein
VSIKGATLHVAMSSPPRRRAFLVAPRPSKAPLKSHAFNVELFLDSAGPGRWVAKLKAKETVFSQGDLGKYVMYLREGAVKLTVANHACPNYDSICERKQGRASASLRLGSGKANHKATKEAQP